MNQRLTIDRPITTHSPLTIDKFGTIEWIDSPREIDASFLEETTSVISHKVEQAFLSPMIENAMDLLFDLRPPPPWARFTPFKGFKTRIRRLFRRKVLSSFDPEFAVETLDNLHESGTSTDSPDGEKLYEMLHELKDLNEILESIHARLFACLKS